MTQSRDWVSLGIAADQLKKPVSHLVCLCEQGGLSGYVLDRWGSKNGYRLLKPKEVAQHYERLVFDRAELAPLLEQFRRIREAEGLRQQLEQERAARQAAEQRAKQVEAEAADLRQQLGNTKTAYEALRREYRAAHDGWTFAQAESTRKGYELTAATAELERLRQLAPTAEYAEYPPETPATGLTFPYATKDLEAMRAVVAQYWEGHTADKRQPTQKTIGHALGELLGLPPQSNGDPARKAIALASAIKPDTLSDA